VSKLSPNEQKGDQGEDRGGDGDALDPVGGPGIPAAPAETDAEALEVGRRLFALPCRFMISAAGVDQIPETDLPEVAFAGRSNVGKSSLLNALAGQKMLAKTSNTPGRTQLLNFFSLGERLILTDLPGYGYAEAPKATVQRWTRRVKAYLRGRAPLRRALLLIDARHGIKDIDRQVMTMLDEAAVSFQAVLTKSDKVRSAELADRLAASARELARHTAAHPHVHATSARTSSGIAELRAALAALAAPPAADRRRDQGG
jgi:GTP-binding protein